LPIQSNWNQTTRICREIIVDEAAEKIVSAAIPKFFNIHETCDYEIIEPTDEELIEALVKYDGWQAEHYEVDGRVYWAAEGKFISPYAILAQEIWDEKYKHVSIPKGYTMIVEVIGGQATNVVSYAEEDLILLSLVKIDTGAEMNYDQLREYAAEVGMRVPERVIKTYGELKAEVAAMDYTQEGYVLQIKNNPNYNRLKLKSRRHMKVFHAVVLLEEVSIINLWNKGELDALINELPEDFRAPFIEKRERYEAAGEVFIAELKEVLHHAPKGERKDIALWAKANEYPYASLLYTILDGKDIRPAMKRHVSEQFKKSVTLRGYAFSLFNTIAFIKPLLNTAKF
jgi:hypothetical protein